MTVHSNLCQHVGEFFLRLLDELYVGDNWFLQDVLTAHPSMASMAVLRKHFPERVISTRGDLEWPALQFLRSGLL